MTPNSDLIYIQNIYINDMNFEWDDNKNTANQEKHGVSFCLAQLAFLDSNRIVLEDLNHSADERRFYCIGKVLDGILTVRFTYRQIKSESFVLDIGEKVRQSMKKKIKYTDELMENIRVIPDFLPSPDNLELKWIYQKSLNLMKNGLKR